MPVSREMQIYNSRVNYTCKTCATKVELVPLASIGTIAMVGLLVLGFWGFILFQGAGYPSGIALGLYGAAIIALVFITGTSLLKHIQNPAIEDNKPSMAFDSASDDGLPKRAVYWLEKFGLLAGLLAPIVVIAGVLGIAALIGYINFTYF